MTDFQTLAQFSAARVLNTMLEGMALAGFSWLLLRVVGRKNAMLRFTVWLMTLAAVVSLPFVPQTAASGAWHAAQLKFSSEFATTLFVAWATIATVLLLRLAISMRHLRQLRSKCESLDQSAYSDLVRVVPLNTYSRPGHPEGRRFDQPTEGSRVCRRIQLLVSDEVRVPTAIGFFRPAVILPRWALAELSAQELHAVVLHEVAHLRRWDDWTNLAQKIFKSLFFFHPAVWWIENRLSVEREIACDDMVLEQTNAKVYGASLVTLAEKAFAKKLRLQRPLALAQSALGRVRQTSLRLAQILDPARPRTKRAWTPALATMGTVLVLTVFLAQTSPEIVSFSGVSGKGTALTAASAVPQNISIATPLGTHVPAIRASQKISTRRASALIPARAKTRPAHKPDLMLAKANVAPQSPELLLFVQTTKVDGSGSAVWTLCVWRVTANNPAAAQTAERIVMSQI
jgi:hypothetical protein